MSKQIDALKLALAAAAGTRAFTFRITLAYVVWAVAAVAGLAILHS